MGGRRRVGDEALRIAEIVRDVDEPQRIEKTEASFLIAGDVKADEAAALLHLPACQFILRVARQPRIEDPGNLGVGLEIAGGRRGGAALPLDAQLERLKP